MLQLVSRECPKIEKFGSQKLEHAHADWLTEHMENLDYDHIAEMLKASPGFSLETFCMRVLCKYADAENPKPKDQRTWTSRETRITLTNAPSFSSERIYSLKHERDNATVLLTHPTLNYLSDNCRK